MLLVTVRGYVVRAGGEWSGDLFVASCEELENLSSSEIYVKKKSNTKKSHKKERRFHVQTNLSNSAIFLTLTRKDRYHELHRTKRYIPNEGTFPIPLKFVVPRRRRRTSSDGASEPQKDSMQFLFRHGMCFFLKYTDIRGSALRIISNCSFSVQFALERFLGHAREVKWRPPGRGDTPRAPKFVPEQVRLCFYDAKTFDKSACTFQNVRQTKLFSRELGYSHFFAPCTCHKVRNPQILTFHDVRPKLCFSRLSDVLLETDLDKSSVPSKKIGRSRGPESSRILTKCKEEGVE